MVPFLTRNVAVQHSYTAGVTGTRLSIAKFGAVWNTGVYAVLRLDRSASTLSLCIVPDLLFVVTCMHCWLWHMSLFCWWQHCLQAAGTKNCKWWECRGFSNGNSMSAVRFDTVTATSCVRHCSSDGQI